MIGLFFFLVRPLSCKENSEITCWNRLLLLYVCILFSFASFCCLAGQWLLYLFFVFLLFCFVFELKSNNSYWQVISTNSKVAKPASGQNPKWHKRNQSNYQSMKPTFCWVCIRDVNVCGTQRTQITTCERFGMVHSAPSSMECDWRREKCSLVRQATLSSVSILFSDRYQKCWPFCQVWGLRWERKKETRGGRV